MTETLYAIDLMGVLYRSHFGFRSQPMLNSRGDDVSAVYGFCSALRRILAEHRPTHWCCALEGQGPLQRQIDFPDYKAGRKPRPDEIVAQLPWAREIAGALGLACLESDGLEADDVLASVAIEAVLAGMDAVVVSVDKDLLQLVGPGVRVLQPAGVEWKWMDEDDVVAKFGVAPERLAHVLALMGDSADNVPGVPGVGAKGAAELVRMYGSVDGIYEALGELKPSLAKKLAEHEASARASLALVELANEPACVPNLDALRVRAEVGEVEVAAARYGVRLYQPEAVA